MGTGTRARRAGTGHIDGGDRRGTNYLLDEDEDTLVQKPEDFDEYNALNEDEDPRPEDRRRDPLRRPV